MKYFNYCNSIFYVIYGLFGAFAPLSLASVLGWKLTHLGQHEMRAYCLFISAVGIILFLGTQKTNDQKIVLKSIIFITFSFLAGRILGLVLDGPGPPLTYLEILFETALISLGLVLLKQKKK
jgi:uncharacterized membrane protein YgdD (TMEM256/DUF423 family)